jgi:hypothetical protein
MNRVRHLPFVVAAALFVMVSACSDDAPHSATLSHEHYYPTTNVQQVGVTHAVAESGRCRNSCVLELETTIPPGYADVFLTLNGWAIRKVPFGETDSVREVAVGVSKARYDASTGELSWQLQATFRGGRADARDYQAIADVAIFGVPGDELTYTQRVFRCRSNDGTCSSSGEGRAQDQVDLVAVGLSSFSIRSGEDLNVSELGIRVDEGSDAAGCTLRGDQPSEIDCEIRVVELRDADRFSGERLEYRGATISRLDTAIPVDAPPYAPVLLRAFHLSFESGAAFPIWHWEAGFRHVEYAQRSYLHSVADLAVAPTPLDATFGVTLDGVVLMPSGKQD